MLKQKNFKKVLLEQVTKVQDIITVDMLEGEEQEIAPMYDPGAYGTVQRCLQGIKGE